MACGHCNYRSSISSGDADLAQQIKDMGRKIYAVMADADAIPSKDRAAYIYSRLDELDDGDIQDAAD